MKALTYALALLAAVRVTRLVTTDYLGHWTLVRPARRWALRGSRWAEEYPHADEDDLWAMVEPHDWPTAPKRMRLVKGLDCPFCVGFWITAAAVGLAAAVSGSVRPRAAFNLVAGAVGANYLTGHLSARLDG